MPPGRKRIGLASLLRLATFGICFTFAILHACGSLGGGKPSGSHNTSGTSKRGPASLTLEGATIAAVDDVYSLNRRKSLLWPIFRKQAVKDEGKILQHMAKKVALAALETERAAQVKVKAALERQSRKHRMMVKQLEAEGWQLSVAERVSRGTLLKGKKKLEEYLRSEAYQIHRLSRTQEMAGRGIAIAAGGPIPLANAYVTIHMLQNVHNCQLPIELYHNGPYEMDQVTKQVFERDFSSLRCVDITKVEIPKHQQRLQGGHALSQQQSGWVLKAQMLYASAFEEVLVLDADNMPLADPSFLFDSPAYAATGSLFWPDFWSSNWHNPGPAYDLLNLTEPWEAQPDLLTTESGQFLLNRRRHDTIIEWILFLNMQADLVYAIIWGDKDSYRLAFALAGEEQLFSQIDKHPANALHGPGSAKAAKNAYSHAGMLQMGPTGELLFLHRTAGSKLDPGFKYPASYRLVDYMTPPLMPRQAALLHITGSMTTAKFDTSRSEACPDSQSLALQTLFAECLLPDEQHRTRSSFASFPIPLMDIRVLPKLEAMLQEGMEVFRQVQQRYFKQELPLGDPNAFL